MSEGKIGAQELKPCPFCGQEAYRSGSIVCCSNRECRAEIHFIYDEELYGEAIKDGVEAWNRRTAPPRDLTPKFMRIKAGWDQAGTVVKVLGEQVFLGQFWTPVEFEDEEDPTFLKSAGLEAFAKADEAQKESK